MPYHLTTVEGSITLGATLALRLPPPLVWLQRRHMTITLSMVSCPPLE